MSYDSDDPRFGQIADSNDTAAALAAGVTLADPVELDVTKVYDRVLPAGATHEVLDLERLLPVPRRAHGRAIVQAVDDLERYVKRHDDTSRTTLWVDAEQHRVIAVLNDHQGVGQENGEEEPGWGDHRVQLQLKPTREWLHWANHDNKLMGQQEFAEHIEDGLLEIVRPDGATMLELAQSIQGTVSAEFQAAHRLQDGNVGVQYIEQTAARAGQKGELEIPATFELAISPFLGEEPVQLAARLRYRIRSGGLAIGYKLDRPEKAILDCIDAIADRLGKTFSDDRVFVGQPRS
jgi:uncharacterized protein YfdQ (DUF2303 family)